MTTPRTVWEAFYGLYTRPFSLTPDLRFEYHSHSHTTAVHEVSEALQRREGLIVVTGPVGTGKTMLCRSLLENIERRTFKCVILDPLLSAEELIIQVLSDFGLLSQSDPARREPMTDVTRHRLVTTLQAFLTGLIPLNAHAVLLIDEAQHCNAQVLEQIRLLSNFETDEAKLLQIVLVGQPALDQLLDQPELRQLHQRVARRVELQPLTKTEVRDYIERRLAVASERPSDEPADFDRSGPVEFDDRAVAMIAVISQGVPRVINTLCDRALQAAFERESPKVDRRAVIAGARHLQLAAPAQRFGPAASAAAAALLLAIAGGLWWFSNRDSTVPADRTTPPPSATTQPPQTTLAPPPSATAASQPAVDAPGGAPSGAPATAPTPTSPAAPATPPATPPAASAPPPTAAAPSRVAASPANQFFEITVASFRTAQRADQVADELAAGGMPVSTKADAGGEWYRVIAGPYPTRTEAEAARTALTQKGFDGTRITTGTPAP